MLFVLVRVWYEELDGVVLIEGFYFVGLSGDSSKEGVLIFFRSLASSWASLREVVSLVGASRNVTTGLKTTLMWTLKWL